MNCPECNVQMERTEKFRCPGCGAEFDRSDDWISVKVRLPEKNGWVICGRTGAKQSFPAWFNGNPLLHPVYGNEHFFIDNRAVHPDVWQYLPEPPKE